MGRDRWIGVAAGLVLGAGLVVGLDAATGDARGQSGFSVSAEQLRINQRISQASVRRGNRALNRLAPVRTRESDAADDGTGGVRPLTDIPGAGEGWSADEIADGAITGEKIAAVAVTGPKIAGGAVTGPKIAAGEVGEEQIGEGAVTTGRLAHPTLAAAVTSGGALDRGIGATGAERLRIGEFAVHFDRDITGCVHVPTVGGAGAAPAAGMASAAYVGGPSGRLYVRTWGEDGSIIDRGFQVVVHC